MYTDEDLDNAVNKGIFTDDSVAQFRAELSSSKNISSVDEENFRLVTSFNDIFVVIACLLLLFSSLWVVNGISKSLGLLVFALLSWGLAEFFVRKKKMALPAIVLLLSFVGGVFVLGKNLFATFDESTALLASGFSAIAAYLHWLRFKVPITVAAGTAAIIGTLIASVVLLLPGAQRWLLLIFFACGVAAFLFAMVWDARDRLRRTYRSDVAFWLHLLSAPLIIHPVFSSLGILKGEESLLSMAIVVVLYLLMTFVSITIDRRAFMVSSLAYVLYAVSNLLKVYGDVGYGFAATGVLIGVALLLLSAFWHSVRKKIVATLPLVMRQYVPATQST